MLVTAQGMKVRVNISNFKFKKMIMVDEKESQNNKLQTKQMIGLICQDSVKCLPRAYTLNELATSSGQLIQ